MRGYRAGHAATLTCRGVAMDSATAVVMRALRSFVVSSGLAAAW